MDEIHGANPTGPFLDGCHILRRCWDVTYQTCSAAPPDSGSLPSDDAPLFAPQSHQPFTGRASE
jgi:hypothetical protein